MQYYICSSKHHFQFFYGSPLGDNSNSRVLRVLNKEIEDPKLRKGQEFANTVIPRGFPCLPRMTLRLEDSGHNFQVQLMPIYLYLSKSL